MPDSKFSRRNFLQAGLGAGAGLALWELYRLGISNKIDRPTASLQAFNETGLDQNQLRKLLDIALAGGGDYADVFLENSLSSYMGFDGEQFQNSGLESVSGAAVRVMTGKRTAFRATGDLSWESLTQAAREAGAAVRAGGRVQPQDLKPLQTPNLYPFTAPALFESINEKQAMINRVVESAKKAYQYVRVARANYRDTLRFLTVATSDGIFAHDAQPLLKIIISVAAINPDNGKTGLGLFSGGGHYGLEYFKEHSPERLGQRAADIARSQLEAVEAPSGQLPVVLGPAYSGVLMHEAVGHGLEADFNVKGYSTYSGRVGEMVASPLCTLYDDGRRASLNGSINFDDEGVVSSRTPLIERGRLVGYMHSRETAAKMNVPLTGNGRRQAFNYPPLPRMTNTYLENGETPPDEIIRSVKSGIYARAFAGGSVNITTGDFTFIPVEAYLIENGRLTAPLANVMLLGNGPEILNRVSMVGNDLEISDNLWECGKQGQMIPVTIGTPTIKVETMTVGGGLRK
jgi:TldD protein